MVETVTTFRTADNKTFPTAWEAWKHEFYLWLRANAIDNDAIALKVVKSLDDNRPESIEALAAIVAGLSDHQPAPAPQPGDTVTIAGDLTVYRVPINPPFETCFNCGILVPVNQPCPDCCRPRD